jgi:hypothetical protein
MTDNRADRAIEWIERHCIIPPSDAPIVLNGWQKDSIRKLYDAPPDGGLDLAECLRHLYTFGPECTDRDAAERAYSAYQTKIGKNGWPIAT